MYQSKNEPPQFETSWRLLQYRHSNTPQNLECRTAIIYFLVTTLLLLIFIKSFILKWGFKSERM